MRRRSIEVWLRDRFFEEHCQRFGHRPFVWHVWDGRGDGFHALVNYHRLAGPNGEGRRTLEALAYRYLGEWIARQRADRDRGVDGADGRLAAAQELQDQLTLIRTGEPPCDLFVRWKPLAEQPMGWEPDLNDGVRINIRAVHVGRPDAREPGGGRCVASQAEAGLEQGSGQGSSQAGQALQTALGGGRTLTGTPGPTKTVSFALARTTRGSGAAAGRRPPPNAPISAAAPSSTATVGTTCTTRTLRSRPHGRARRSRRAGGKAMLGDRDSRWPYPGARWWKFDLHTHTPASVDYDRGPTQTSPRDWLLDYMQAGVDCVAVTDHNSGEWIDELKAALAALELEASSEYRPLYLFPGVEITANGGIHVLAVLDPGKGGERRRDVARRGGVWRGAGV